MPLIPQSEAGMRIEPPVSEPSAAGARAASSAASAQTVMNALSLPSSAVTRSRKARTTSTGETSLVRIMRESSVTERHTRSGISEHPVLRGRLDARERQSLETRQEVEGARHGRPDRLELGVAPVEPGELTQDFEGLQASFHR